MSKKDRIAVVFSIMYFCTIVLPAGLDFIGYGIFFFFSTVLMVYWGYRFIKNDISFLNIKED